MHSAHGGSHVRSLLFPILTPLTLLCTFSSKTVKPPPAIVEHCKAHRINRRRDACFTLQQFAYMLEPDAFLQQKKIGIKPAYVNFHGDFDARTNHPASFREGRLTFILCPITTIYIGLPHFVYLYYIYCSPTTCIVPLPLVFYLHPIFYCNT